ncbi:hypothetical protein DPEC_G00317850 [Dallia pectoralis]|uniref:Uncharacterized protein n=1 Tax=Dallia pectoralis TaxID=75939 RepID=A0ACC2FDE2_DALPE|nr:hypothetical protein DPEC_G00317850 [Dallia pectoralis]
MSDGWVFDVETHKWREIEHPYMNKPRLWHTACQGRDSEVHVFGGSCDFILLVDKNKDNTRQTIKGHCNDVLVLQIKPYSLFRICEDYIAKNVKNCKMLQRQLPYMPAKILAAVQKRISYFQTPSKK